MSGSTTFKKLTLKIVGVSPTRCRLEDGTEVRFAPSILREIEGEELKKIIEFLKSNKARLVIAEGYYKSGKSFVSLALGEEEMSVKI